MTTEHDLRRALTAEADRPAEPPAWDAVVQRGRHHRRVARARVGVLAAAVALLLPLGAVALLQDEPHQRLVTDQPEDFGGRPLLLPPEPLPAPFTDAPRAGGVGKAEASSDDIGKDSYTFQWDAADASLVLSWSESGWGEMHCDGLQHVEVRGVVAELCGDLEGASMIWCEREGACYSLTYRPSVPPVPLDLVALASSLEPVARREESAGSATTTEHDGFTGYQIPPGQVVTVGRSSDRPELTIGPLFSSPSDDACAVFGPVVDEAETVTVGITEARLATGTWLRCDPATGVATVALEAPLGARPVIDAAAQTLVFVAPESKLLVPPTLPERFADSPRLEWLRTAFEVPGYSLRWEADGVGLTIVWWPERIPPAGEGCLEPRTPRVRGVEGSSCGDRVLTWDAEDGSTYAIYYSPYQTYPDQDMDDLDLPPLDLVALANSLRPMG